MPTFVERLQKQAGQTVSSALGTYDKPMNQSYTVFGFQSGTLDTPTLHQKIILSKHALAPLPLNERMMRGYGVDSQGHGFLEQRFKKQFENFVLLDDVAIEACRTFDVPYGKELGKINLDEMGGLALPLFKWAYYTDAKLSEG